jgi:preprotein translocase subunit SecE
VKVSVLTTREKKKLSYFREVQNELKRVTWTSKEELLFCTKAVIISTFVFGFMIYLVDLTIRGLLDSAGTFVRMLFG